MLESDTLDENYLLTFVSLEFFQLRSFDPECGSFFFFFFLTLHEIFFSFIILPVLSKITGNYVIAFVLS